MLDPLNKLQVSYSMEQSFSWEANYHSASQVSQPLWNLKIHYCVHKSPPSSSGYILKTIKYNMDEKSFQTN
jgi:hypothetical protein